MSKLESWSIARLREELSWSKNTAKRGGASALESIRLARENVNPKPSRLAVAAAFGAIYLIWGSTYLAIKYAIETIPPFLMAGARFLIAGALLCGWARLNGANGATDAKNVFHHWRAALVTGALLFVCGNGGVTWAEQHRLASSLAALLMASEPLWVVLLNWACADGARSGGRVLCGLLVGLCGVGLLVTAQTAASGARLEMNPLGVLVVTGAAFSWALGSLYSPRANLPASPRLASGMQMLAGGIMLLLVGALSGELTQFDLRGVTVRSIFALAYLIVFGSIVAFTAYGWLLRVTTPARAATYAYVNPAVAVALGWLIGGETLTPRILVAAAVIIASVVLITSSKASNEAEPTKYK
jgi:drug/metabolite transporter (DMT)-like permease